MSRAAINPVSKLSRSIGSSAATRPVLESSGLTPAYAELLRSHRRNQWDNHHPATTSKPFATTTFQAPTTNPIVLPTHPHPPPSSQIRHTPVPMMSRPRTPPSAPAAPADTPQTPHEVVFIADDPHNVTPSLEDLDKIDVDEAQLQAQGSSTSGEPESKGMVKDIWEGVMDDVFGQPKVKRS